MMQNGRHPLRADYDWREFAALTRRRLAGDGRGYRALAEEIGITFTDLSRAASGQMIAVHKVVAICDWLGISVRQFYLPPIRENESRVKSTCCTATNVKHGATDPARGSPA